LKSTFVIPCYNEESNIDKLFSEVLKLVYKNDNINFIFVSNGPLDNTHSKLKALVEKFNNKERVSIVSIEKNIGYGNGVLQGIKAVNTTLLGWIHADLQVDLKNIEIAVDLYNDTQKKFPNSSIYIRGKRTNRDSFIDKIFTNLMAVYTSVVKRGVYSDITGLPVLMETEQFKQWGVPPLGFALDVYSYIFAKKNNAKIIRFPVKLNLRERGKSSWNTGFVSRLKMSLYYLKEIKNIEIKKEYF